MLDDTHRSYYIDLLQKVLTLYELRHESRVIIGLTGPTGAGKSLIAALLAELTRQIQTPFEFHTLGIDAYHFTNAYLQTHSANGKDLKEQKGRPETYDVAQLIADITGFRAGETVSFPAYSRITHEPIRNAQIISNANALLLIEGLWLQYDKCGWEQIGPLLDFSIFIDADKERVRDAVIARHMRGGRNSADAAAYYDSVDATNFDAVLPSKQRADIIIPAYYKV